MSKKIKSRNNIYKSGQMKLNGIRENCNPIAQVRRIKNCFLWSYQRITKGYADIDLWNMDYYLQNLFAEMLSDFKKSRHGTPVIAREQCVIIDDVDAEGNNIHDMWDKILDRMIFLWEETSEETCSKRNTYEEKFNEACDEFTSKYGILGEKVNGADVNKENEIYIETIHHMDEMPEYREISNLYYEEERRIERYREKCKDEAFDLMKKYFFYLWD